MKYKKRMVKKKTNITKTGKWKMKKFKAFFSHWMFVQHEKEEDEDVRRNETHFQYCFEFVYTEWRNIFKWCSDSDECQ